MSEVGNNIQVKRVALDSLGCKLNRAEVELLARQFIEAGYRLVLPDAEADIYILNTCTVTHIADRKSRHLLRMARRRNPGARVVVVGCYAERAARELEKIEGVDLVLGNTEKWQLLRILEEEGDRAIVSDATTCGTSVHRTRAFIKVQDGCRHFCAYCIVPLVRSKEESIPADLTVEEISKRVADGYQEVVLTGTEIGRYDGGIGLVGLLGRVLAETPVRRVRLSSLQPSEISPGLIGLWQNERMCPHFHLSLQSGSDGVLRRMKRSYTTAGYLEAVSLIRRSVPEVAITTDMIVGFPGETEAEFRESYDFCRQVGFARIHVFPYSPRSGTEAASMPGRVDSRVKTRRSREMLSLASEGQRNFYQTYLGRTVEVLFEQQVGNLWSGLTGNYIRVYAASGADLTSRLVPMKLSAIYSDGVWGETS